MKITKTAGQNGILITLKELQTIGVKIGQRINITKWQAPISNNQRKMLFAYYDFCLDHGLRELGHFSTDGFHEDVKAWVNHSHRHDFGGNISITRMDKVVFDLFWKMIDLELLQGILCIDTSLFWAEYQIWRDSGTEQAFSEWKDDRAA